MLEEADLQDKIPGSPKNFPQPCFTSGKVAHSYYLCIANSVGTTDKMSQLAHATEGAQAKGRF